MAKRRAIVADEPKTLGQARSGNPRIRRTGNRPLKGSTPFAHPLTVKVHLTGRPLNAPTMWRVGYAGDGKSLRTLPHPFARHASDYAAHDDRDQHHRCRRARAADAETRT